METKQSMQGCRFPNCKRISQRKWANVDLCDFHYETIKHETDDHYMIDGKKGISYKDRYFYLQIAPMIPWSQVNQKRRLVDVKGNMPVHSG